MYSCLTALVRRGRTSIVFIYSIN